MTRAAENLIAAVAVEGNFLDRIAELERWRGQRARRGVNVVTLSELGTDLGLIMSGEFRAGNNVEIGDGFSGVRIGYPGFTYGGSSWNIAGVTADVLQFGLSATTGAAYAGAGAVLLDATGITLTIGSAATNQIKWITAAGGATVGYIYGDLAVANEYSTRIYADARAAAVGTHGLVYIAAYAQNGDLVSVGIDSSSAFRGVTITADGTNLEQATADTIIMEYSSTGDVAHGVTDIAPTAVWGFDQKISGAEGGWAMQGFRDANATAVYLAGTGVTADTTKSSSGSSIVELAAWLKSGTAQAAVGAAGNIVGIRNGSTVLFLFDADAHQYALANHSATTPQLDLIQAGSGDAALRFAIGTAHSYAVGLDNSDSDFFKVSYAASGAAALGTTDVLTLDGGNVRLGLGNTSAPLSKVEVNTNSDTFPGQRDIAINLFTASTAPATFIARKSRNTTIGSHTIVVSGDSLGSFFAYGSDGSAWQPAGGISVAVDGTPGANDMPGRLVFYTTPDGSVTLTERLRIDSAGGLTHAGSGATLLGLRGATPLAAPDWTITNPAAADRTIDVSGDAIGAVRTALGTLIQDLIDVGLLQ